MTRACPPRWMRPAAEMHAYWRLRTTVSRTDLPAGQSAARSATRARSYQAATIGHWAPHRDSFHLRAPEPRHPRARPDMTTSSVRAMAAGLWRTRIWKALYRALSGPSAGIARALRIISPVLVAVRRAEPCRAGNTRLDTRGRRAWLCARACVRRAFDNPN